MSTEALRFDATVNANTRDLGKMADALGDVRGELRKLDKTKAEPEVDVKTDKALRDLDRFAAQMRKKLDSAIKNLPEIEINADSSDVDKELAKVKRDLATLRDAKIGVDIDAATAEAKLRELRATLTRLNAESVDIKVKTDTLAAVKALGNIKLDAVDLPVSTDKAEKKVGAFAADLQKKLTAAAKSLPEIDLTADSSDVDRDIARIGNELRALADQRIGIDIDATQAHAEAARLEAELKALSGQTLTVQADADVAAALSALKLVDAEVDKVDGKKATVKVDVDKSLSDSIVKVAALGRALGMLAVPAAALAAAPQIAAIGAAAVSASGAIGLLPAALGALGLAQATVTAGFGDLTTALTGSEKAAKEAYAGLSSTGKQMVDTIKSFGPAWDDIKHRVQDKIFGSLIADVSALGKTYLPVIGTEMERVASGFNTAGQRVAEFLRQSSTVKTVETALAGMRGGIVNAAGAVAPLLKAFVDLSAVGSTFLPQLGSQIAAATTRFSEFIAKARATGELQTWIQQGIDAVEQLGSIVGNVGSILLSVFRSATTEGANLLQTLDELTGRAAAFLKSAEGQSALKSLFSEIRDGVDAAMPGLEAIGRVVVELIQKLGDANVLQKAGQAFSAIAEAAAPVLSVLGDIVATVLPPLLDLVRLLAPALVPVAVGILAIKAATAGFAAAQKFPQWLMSAKDAAMGSEQRMTALGRAVDAAKTPFTQAGESVRRFGDQLKVQQDLASKSGQEVGKLGAASAVLQQRLQGPIGAVKQFGTEVSGSYSQANTAVRSFADQAGKSANTATVALGDRLAAAAQRGVDGVLKLPDASKQAASALSTGLQQAVIRTNVEMEAMPQRAASAASTLRTGLGVAAIDAGQKVTALGAAARDAGSTVATGLGVAAIDTATKIRQLPAAASEAGTTLRTAIGVAAVDAGDKLRALGTSAADTGRSLASGLQSGVTSSVTAVRQLGTATADAGRAMATGLQSGVTSAVAAVRQLPTATAEAGRALATNLRDGATQAGTALSTGLRSGVTAASDALRSLPSVAASAGQSLASGLRDGALAGGRALGDGVRTGVTAVGDALRSAAETARSGASTVASAVGDGLRAIPGTIQSTFNSVGAAVNTGIGHLGRFSGAVTGVATALGTTMKKGVVGLTDALGGPFGVALTAASVQAGVFQSGVDKGTAAMLAGGKAAQTYTAGADSLGERLVKNTLAFVSFGLAADVTPTLDSTAASTKKLYDAMTPLQQAQTDVTRAFNDYQAALSRGDTAAAAEALARYQAALGRVKDINDLATEAAKSYNDVLRDQVTAAQSVLGANLALDDSLARVQEAQDAANKAADEHGVKSKEAAQANRDLVQAVDQAAQAAGRKAEADAKAAGATDAADQGASAYASTLLSQAATLKGPARDAVLSYLGTLSQAQLDSLSAAAATSGFATEVIKLPNGKTVKVAVDPETGKIVDTKAQLDSIKSRTVMISVNGSAAPAQKVIADIVAAINAGQGTITINGNPVPVNQAVQALLANVNTQHGTIQLDGNPTLVNGKVTQAVTFADGSHGSIQIDGNPDPATGKVTATVTYANGQTGVIQLAADPTQANATVAGVKTSATAQVTFPLASDPSSAQGSVAGVQGTARTPQSFPTGSDTGAAQGSVTAVQGLARIAQIFGLSSNTAPAQGAVSGVQGQARAPQTFPTNSNTGPAQGAVSGVQGQARQQQTFNTNSNTGQAQGAVSGVQGQARQWQIFGVGANTQGAWSSLASLFNSWASKIITWTVRILTPGFSGMVYPAQTFATGGSNGREGSGGGTPTVGIVDPAGTPRMPGGRRLTPTSNARASIAKPNSWRVFGDRPDVDEFFIPDNSAPLSMALASEWADRRGMTLVPAKKMATGGKIQAEDGSYVNPDFYSKVSPQYAAAQGMVQAEDGSYVPPSFYDKTSTGNAGGAGSFGSIGVGFQVMANGGIVTAAGEILQAYKRGANVYEDFTFQGASPLVGQYNDALAKLFYSSHKGFDYGPAGSGDVVTKWLAGYIAVNKTGTASATARPAPTAVATSPATSTPPATSTSSARAGSSRPTRSWDSRRERSWDGGHHGSRGNGCGQVDVAAIVAGLQELKAALGRPNVAVTNNNPVAERGSDSAAQALRTLSSMGLFGGRV